MRGRLTKNQKYFLKNYIEKFEIKYKNKKIKINNFFSNNNNKTILEIGFGNGSNLIKSAINNRNINFIGIDIYLPGIGNILSLIYKKFIKNIKIINYNINKVINKMIFENSIFEIRIFFPDPWNKKKHKKRRLINIQFIENLLKILKKKRYIHIITDSEDYFNDIFNNLNILCNKNRIIIFNLICYKQKLINTIFEEKAIKYDNNIFYVIVKKK